MKKRFLEAGQIVNTHGIRGEVKIVPWADSAEFLTRFKKLYIDGSPVDVKKSYVHKGSLIASFDGVENVDSAVILKNKTVCINRDDANLDENKFFIQDIIGASVIDDDTGETVGKVKDIIGMPAHNLYVLDCGSEVLIPDVPDFIKQVDPDEYFVKIHFIEGMR